MGGDPDVFDNYLDDSLRFVDVPQEVVLKACLPNGDDTVKKIQKAYDKCFGDDYSFDDLADTVGRDSDNDDLPDEYEGNEACFYKTMDWVKGNEVQPSVIEADMAGVPGFEMFQANINSCSAWSGNFGGRRKRAVGEATEDKEEVPSIMENGSGALQWVKSLVRRARSAEPGNDKNEGGKEKKNKKGGKKKGKKGGKGGVRKGKKGGKNEKKGGKNGKKGGKSATKTRKRKNGNSKKGKNGKKNVRKSNKKNGGKKGNKGKNGNKANKANRKKGGKKGKKGNKGGNKARKGRKNKKGGKNKKNKQDKKKDKKQQRKQERKEKKKEKKKNDKKNDKKKDGDKKKGRSGKSSDLLPDFVYNQLWCFDLAMEQALEQCVEDRLN